MAYTWANPKPLYKAFFGVLAQLSLQLGSLFGVPDMVRHPYQKDSKRNPKRTSHLDPRANFSLGCRVASSSSFGKGLGLWVFFGGSVVQGLGLRVSALTLGHARARV